MGSATRAALATATSALAAERGATLETGEQLLAAGRSIADSGQLRSLLADPAVIDADKASIIQRVFGALDPAAARLLTAAVGERWSSPDDLVDGIEELGIRVIAAASDDDARIVSELFRFSSAVSSDPALELAVGAKLGDRAGKVSLVDSLLGGKASPATIAIAQHLVQSPRGRRTGALIAHAAAVVADASGGIVATVTAASPLSDAQVQKLSTALTAQYGRTPRLNLVIDPSIIGGLRVQVGDDVIDGSVSARLHDLRIQLAG